MHPIASRRFPAWFAAWTALVSLSALAGAQAPPSPDAAARQPPAPLTVLDVAREADAASARLSEIQGNLANLPAAETITSQVESLESSLQEMELDLGSRSLDRMDPRALDDLRREWIGHRDRIEATSAPPMPANAISAGNCTAAYLTRTRVSSRKPTGNPA